MASDEGFTTAEVKELKALARRLAAERKVGKLRTGVDRVTSLRVDAGLLDALKGRADKDGQTQGEAINRAIEVYLAGV